MHDFYSARYIASGGNCHSWIATTFQPSHRAENSAIMKLIFLKLMCVCLCVCVFNFILRDKSKSAMSLRSNREHETDSLRGARGKK
jgi:hypothetical protein